jgi:predicted nucleic acid-binding protein
VKSSFVADASVAVSWCTSAQASEATDRLLDDIGAGATVVVPPLWLYEIANALLVLARRKKLTAADYSEARLWLSSLRISVDNESTRLAATRVADLALEHELTVCDAAYLELAVRKQIPLASRDQSLTLVARRLSVTLLL